MTISKVEAMKAYLFQVCAMVGQGKDVLFEVAALKRYSITDLARFSESPIFYFAVPILSLFPIANTMS